MVKNIFGLSSKKIAVSLPCDILITRLIPVTGAITMSSIHGKTDYQMVSFWNESHDEIINKIKILRKEYAVKNAHIFLIDELPDSVQSFKTCNKQCTEILSSMSGFAEVYRNVTGALCLNYDW